MKRILVRMPANTPTPASPAGGPARWIICLLMHLLGLAPLLVVVFPWHGDPWWGISVAICFYIVVALSGG